MREEVFMLSPIGVLFILSTVRGSVFSWLYLNPYFVILSISLKLIFLFIGVRGIIMLLYKKLKIRYCIALKGPSILWYFLGGMWFLPFLSTFLMVKPLRLGAYLLKYLDQGWMEELGGQGRFYKIVINTASMDKWSLLGLKSYLILFFIFMIMIFLVQYCSNSLGWECGSEVTKGIRIF